MQKCIQYLEVCTIPPSTSLYRQVGQYWTVVYYCRAVVQQLIGQSALPSSQHCTYSPPLNIYILPGTAPHYPVPHRTVPYCTALHWTTLPSTALHYTKLNRPALHYTAQHWTSLHSTSPHCAAFPSTALHYTALQCTAFQCTALPITTLHAINWNLLHQNKRYSEFQKSNHTLISLLNFTLFWFRKVIAFWFNAQ